jgi:nicotinamidase/pyrazinamidase
MMKKSALIVVDMQNDFCPGGALAVAGGDEIVPVINSYLEFFRESGRGIISSRDWHPLKTRHFRKFGGIWPEHCVQGSHGAEFHAGLNLTSDTLVFSKGTDTDRDDYSALQARDDSGEPMCEYLKRMDIREIYVCGLATDYCVLQTVLDALSHGFTVKVLADAIRGVELSEGDSERAIGEMSRAGAEFLTFGELYGSG